MLENRVTWSGRNWKPKSWSGVFTFISDRLLKLSFQQKECQDDPKCFIGTVELADVDQRVKSVGMRSSYHYYVELKASNAAKASVHLIPLKSIENVTEKRDIWSGSFRFYYKIPDYTEFTCRVMACYNDQDFYWHDGYSDSLTFREDMEYCDVQLQVGDKSFKAHKFILASRSKFFKDIFDQNSEDTVQIFDTEYEIMKAILQYIYNAFVMIDSTNVYKLSVASHKYDLVCLKQKCNRYLVGNIDASNAINTLRICHVFGPSCILRKDNITDYLSEYDAKLVKDPQYEEYWRQNLDVDNIHYVLVLANKYNMKALKDAAMDYIKIKPEVMKRPKFDHVLEEKELTRYILENMASSLKKK